MGRASTPGRGGGKALIDLVAAIPDDYVATDSIMARIAGDPVETAAFEGRPVSALREK
jgi:hypothetical protein